MYAQKNKFKPKSIFLLSSGPRTGSTWLAKALSRVENTNTCIEIFNPNLNKEILSVEKNPKEYVHYVLKKIDQAKEDNKNFLFTSFLDYFNRIEVLSALSMVSDVLIFNYRDNILHQWISFIKSYNTKQWQNKNLTNVIIHWSEKYFLDFKHDCDKVFDMIRVLSKSNLVIPTFNYEEIHSFETDSEKIGHVNSKINQCGLEITDYSNIDLKKQNDYYNLKECFSNFDEFVNFKNEDSFKATFVKGEFCHPRYSRSIRKIS